MANGQAGKSTNILVGCGGSGISTLIRLNGLLAEDPYWRANLDEEIYYILVDTDTSMLDKFAEAMHRQLHGARLPTVRYLPLAKGLSSIEPVVVQRFITPFAEGEDERGKGRLLEHWWAREEGPYRGERIVPLSKGAGQCPPVSYYLIWRALPRLASAFEELMKERLARLGGMGGEAVNFIIVAGLAGGTGRGCWEVLAFKIRQLFAEKGLPTPAPMAFLYDSSTFYDVAAAHPDQAMQMRVNALTGVSELSAWMRNIHAPEGGTPPRYPYNLPSFESPAEAALDVLRIDLTLDVNRAAPVNSAYLVFDRSDIAVLDGNEQYQQMVGTALYAALSKSEIDSQAINSRMPYLGIAAASFEVNASTLRDYFEHLARLKAVRSLRRPDAARVPKWVEQVVKKAGLSLDVSARDRRAYKPDPKGTLLQRVCAAVMERYRNALATLDQHLREDDVEMVLEHLDTMMAENEALVEEATEAGVRALDRQPVDLVREALSKLYSESGSVENVRLALTDLSQRLRDQLEALPSVEQMRLTADEDPTDYARSAAGREYKLFGRHFNEQEREEVVSRARLALLRANYHSLRQQMEKTYEGLLGVFGRWRKNAAVLDDQLSKLDARLNGELSRDVLARVGGEKTDLFDALFTDPAAPERGLPDKFAMAKFYRRDLKPVLAEGKEMDLLEEPALAPELGGLLLNAVLEDHLDPDDRRKTEQLFLSIEREVHQKVRLPQGFIRDKFSIHTVTDDLLDAWLRRLNNEGDSDTTNELLEQFEAFFGVRPVLDGDTWTAPSGNDLLLSMGASLARTCKPFWMLRPGKQAEERSVTVFLPPTPDRFDSEAAGRYMEEKLGTGIVAQVYTEHNAPTGWGQSRANPFVLLAYARDGVEELGSIASLDYWKEAKVAKVMSRCEDPHGSLVYGRDLGFTDPLYVRNDVIRKIRWRPWPDPGEDVTLEVERETLDALAYALLEPTPDLAGKLAALGWTLPLVRDVGRERYQFARLAYVFEDGRGVEDPTSPWKSGEELSQSICWVFSVLEGHEDPTGAVHPEAHGWREGMLAESKEFWTHVGTHVGCVPGSDSYRELLRSCQSRFRAAQDGARDERDAEVWQKLVEHIGRRLQEQ